MNRYMKKRNEPVSERMRDLPGIRSVVQSRILFILVFTILLLTGYPAISYSFSSECYAADNAETSVYDQAGLFSSEETENLSKQIQQLDSLADSIVFAVTTDDAEGYSAQDYAEKFYLEHTDQEDGAVFLIDMDNREIYIATSGEMILWLTDERIDRILDKAYDRISSGEYAGCMSVMIQSAIGYVKTGEQASYTYNLDTGETVYVKGRHTLTVTEVLIALAAGLAAGLLVFFLVIGKYRMKFSHYRYDFRKNSRLTLSVSEDRLVNRFVTRRRIPRNPPPSGGGRGFSGGGSTIHTGGGGHSFGGGGRKF